ncbi:MFS transporter [Weissella diestrammenae]|uniref:MFS transporter n=1 Tax=Weissella diestrammenae TaxID=1162633 RepID=A0A7G9T3M0_9LACO|nr:MFS transporter [Weissella diestrammenae]MCM0582672.1 MFS transporter [Weissella diestrammenae]QNN74695.1 MFS transporter [Weissella diestrammenae]
MDATNMNVEKSTKMPKKLAIGLLIGCMSWMGPYTALSGTLLPAKIGVLDEAHKVMWVSTFALIAMVVATIANIIEGALSDRTRTKIGRRKPWIIGGTIASVIMFFFISWAPTVQLLLTFWVIYQIGLNAIVAPMVAIISDSVSKKHRGTASAFYGVGMSVGAYGSAAIAAPFLGNITGGIWTMAGIQVVLATISMLLIKQKSSKDDVLLPLKGKDIFNQFIFPVTNARDFYLAAVGKLLFQVATGMFIGYQLYILTDYMLLSTGKTASILSMMSLLMMVISMAMGALAGPLADKLGTLKIPVMVASVLVGIGGFMPFISNQPWTMLAYAVIAGVGTGMYLSVDQALNIAVLPNPATAAKDLGIINLSATLGQIIGPIVAGIIISSIGYRYMFIAVAVSAILGGIMILFIKKVK